MSVRSKYIFSLFLLFLLFISSVAQAQSFSGKVVSIIDGKTIRVLQGGKRQRVHLFGIQCADREHVIGKKARKYTGNHASHKIVRVDQREGNRFGETIGDVSLPDGRNLNQVLVQEGLCWWDRKAAPNDQVLKDLEAQAKALKRGIWADRYSHLVAQETETVKPGEAPGVRRRLPVVANRRTKVYYTPGCTGYNDLHQYNRIVFPNPTEAKRAGYSLASGCRASSY